MKGHLTTYLGLFDDPVDAQAPITGIKIPIIQRDYAQGRLDDEALAIRRRFAKAVVGAAYGTPDVVETGLGLDFVYGDVRDGVLQPLDGQQRLTTLYLLHWYVASRAGVHDPSEPWLGFSYATRPSARYFAAALREHPLPDHAGRPSVWLADQPWYLYPWQDDPTIASMLVMLDAIHEAVLDANVALGADAARAWTRLSNRTHPQIWFHFLPVADLDRGEDLYLKMNSRGKPLTKFEVLKADLEDALKPPLLTPEQHAHLTVSFDLNWTDVFWEYQKAWREAAKTAADVGAKTPPAVTVDGAFMRYLGFIVEVCEWRDGDPGRRWSDPLATHERTLEERSRLAFADPGNKDAERNREFLLHAFDTWCAPGEHPATVFPRLFRVGDVGTGPLPLLVSAAPDLVGICVGSDTGLTLPETLLLYGVLVARRLGQQPSETDLNRRLRTLRNLVETAVIQRKRMPEYLRTVDQLVSDGVLDDAQSFNADWAADQRRVWAMLDEHPEVAEAVHALEDHPIVRGRLLAFELDAATLPQRAATFASVAKPGLRDDFGAALLTYGDYSRDVGWDHTKRQFGSSELEESWREILTIGSREQLVRVRRPLMALLDDAKTRLAADPEDARDIGDALRGILDEWCGEREARAYFDWRYYVVRYQGARSTVGQGYFHGDYDESTGGFGYAKLHILHGNHYSAYFSDALLLAAWTDGQLQDVASKPRWYRVNTGMTVGRIAIWCAEDGFDIEVPHDAGVDAKDAVAHVRASYRTNDDGRVLVDQRADDDARQVDVEDRVQLCIRLVRDLATSVAPLSLAP